MNNKLVWEFDSKEESSFYLLLRRKRLFRESRVPVAFSMFLTIGVLSSSSFIGSGWAIIVCFVVLLLFQAGKVKSYIMRRKCGPARSEISLENSGLVLFETYGKKVVEVDCIPLSSIKSANWQENGCLFNIGFWRLLRPDVLVPMSFYNSPGSVRAFLEWAEHNDLEMEGVPPLGVYQRPIEGEHRL